MRPIIRVENLGKRYRLGGAPPPTLREALVQTLMLPAARRRGMGAGGFVWALKDLNFEIYPGEVVGIVGRNGSGKSTLLKILSRITKPSTGAADIYGRVGSLLEIGTGFHPELTGRENVFLNGVLLGMARAEVERKFDEIVAFAEIGPFLDVPVKRYSSGMYLRLAFAIAAHLESELLLLDEVLAVGDVGFQKKCLAKMKEISRKGRTALFVSHKMEEVESLCGRVFLLESGTLREEMEKETAIARYLGAGAISEEGYSGLSADGER